MDKVAIDQFAEKLKINTDHFVAWYKEQRENWIKDGNPDDDWPAEMRPSEWLEQLASYIDFEL
jgi:hypothetical protein